MKRVTWLVPVLAVGPVRWATSLAAQVEKEATNLPLQMPS